MELLVYHVDTNSAYLSWTAVALLERGYEKVIRKIPAVIAEILKTGMVSFLRNPFLPRSMESEPEKASLRREKCLSLEVYPPDYDLYLHCSEAMYRILYEYTPVIQRPLWMKCGKRNL